MSRKPRFKIQLYNATSIENADIGSDASRATTQDTYHEPC